MRMLLQFMVFIPLAWCAATTPAAAYLDPSAGSMFLQSLLALLAAGGALLGVYWRKIRDFFVKMGSSGSEKRKS